jgi:hypothetical protein
MNKKLANFLAVIAFCLSGNVFAQTKIAILDFELHDLTLAPRIPTEIERTAAVKGMLEGELKSAGYQIIPVQLDAQQYANSGFGYLFDHDDVAAELAKKIGADYILVGRLHKPSFLFAYLMGHLVKADNAALLGNFIVESKGSDKKLTLKGVETLTVKIDQLLDKAYTPPEPKK